MASQSQTLKSIVKELTEKANQVILDATLTNYTPLLLGDYKGRTKEVAYNKSQRYYTILADPTKAIIGKSRWLLRTLIATIGHAGTHSEAENWPKLTIRDCKGNIIVEGIGLTQLIYGSASPRWKGLYTIQTQITLDKDDANNSIININLLNKISRLKLLTSNKSELEKCLIAPIDINKAQLQLRITRRNQCIKITLENNNTIKQIEIKELDKLVISLTLITLQILGIGAVANRGFGRFHIISNKVNTQYKEDNPISNIIKITEYKSRDELRIKMKKIFEDTINIIYNIIYKNNQDINKEEKNNKHKIRT
ncbi:MAG: type III-B CRISPR module RAMP protein Cmr1, partial [Desulfurococcales archaeon]|nr:type III-B CRISPR module RAMP protein Cmr1 [Desulfurococcales archaeon]